MGSIRVADERDCADDLFAKRVCRGDGDAGQEVERQGQELEARLQGQRRGR
jgi:hypothetical protein